ncbi:MAG: hypothetical protein ACW97V_00555 [Promethearchaeota archaeon]
MDEQKDEEFDEDGFDPTKDAFFSDLIGIEEEIASEAYELVAHALTLIESKYYADGIEVLRQAIGMYTQINREDEIEAITDKIAEVYLLKEQQFRESEAEPVGEEIRIEEGETTEIIANSDAEIESVKEEIKADSHTDIEQLLNEGKEFLDSNNFEEALDIYDKAVEFYEGINNPIGVEKVFTLIEECYNQKADFLRNVKKEATSAEVSEEVQVVVEQERLVTEVSLKEERMKKYHNSKERELEMSAQAYDVLGKAAELAQTKQFDEALRLYKEGADLFHDLGWVYETKKVRDTIDEVTKEKEALEYQLEMKKVKEEEIHEPMMHQVEKLEQQVQEREDQEKVARLERLRGIEFQKMENEFFKAQIDNMATEALRMAREYELSMQRAIKKGELVEECIYPKVIETYIKVKELLIDKDWKSEAAIYDDTINIYIQKFEQDKKIRQIEAEKVRKQKDAEDALKISRDEELPPVTEVQQQRLDEQHEKQVEVENTRADLEEMAKKAERLAREYEVALRRGKFELKCPYPEIINIYRSVKKIAVERGWETDVAIFISQIQVYTEKLEKDKKIRQIEAEKVRKQIDARDALKISRDEELPTLTEDQQQRLDVQHKKQIEVENIRANLEEMTKKAERLAREYEVALRRGKFELKCPYPEIINIYRSVKKIAVERGWETDKAIFISQIQAFTEKLEKDKALRQVEADKQQKQKEMEEVRKFHKKKKSSKVDEEKLKEIEKQALLKEDEENFDDLINRMVTKAERMGRDYDAEMKKAVRRGRLAENPPYEEIIGIYEKLKQMTFAKGRDKESAGYKKQISFYSQKWEKDNNLRELEAKKLQQQKDIEDMRKIDRPAVVDQKRLKGLERKKEEEDFNRNITDEVDRAEKLVREHEQAMRKAMRGGKIIENTPYLAVIDIYKNLREKVYARGWKEQAEVYKSQINIYQDKLEKHERLLEVEVQKVQRQKDVEEMYKVDKISEVSRPGMKSVELKKEEKAFQKDITNLANKAEKLEREYELALKKALKKGEFIQQSPYPEIIDIYIQIKERLKEKGWVDQVEVYTNQIRIYQEKLAKTDKIKDIEAKKLERQIEIDGMHRIKKDYKPEKSERIKEIEKKDKEEDLLLDKAMGLIDDAEKLVKNYEVNIKTDVFLYESPYDGAIANYTEAKKLFQQIGWNDELAHLNSTITFYKEKKEKDERLRDIERNKLKEPEIELLHAKTDTEKELFAREERLLKLEKMKKEEAVAIENIFNEIRKAERLAQEYELKVKDGNLDFEAPYEEVLKIYRIARKSFEEIGWVEESMKLLNTIQFYKEKDERDKRLRAFESEKAKKEEEELVTQKKLLEQAKREQERFLKQREKTIIEKKTKVSEFETAKDKAFRLMDRAKGELTQNNFDLAVQFYQESEVIFTEIGWQEGILMVRDSIAMIQRKQKLFKDKEVAVEEQKLQKLKIEEKLEERFVQAKELKKAQQEVKREEFLKTQKLKRWEEEISEEAYKILELGTSLLNKKKFDEAHEKYIEARALFGKISWKREVSRINNDLLYKLQREKKTAETLDELKVKVKEEKKEMEVLKEETERERLEYKKRKKEEKRKLKKDEFDKKILRELDKADALIEDLKYNEGILALNREKKKTEREDFLNRIENTINRIKEQTQIPLIALEPFDKVEDLPKFKNAYIALDKAQFSLKENICTRAISELKEAKFNLNDLAIGNKYLEQIDELVKMCQEKLGRKPSMETKALKEAPEDRQDVLKAKLETRREERRKRVLDLLKKSKEDED